MKHNVIHRVYATVVLTVAAESADTLYDFERVLQRDLTFAANQKARQKRQSVEIIVPPVVDLLNRPAVEVGS